MSLSPHPDRAGWRPLTPEEEQADAELKQRLVEQRREQQLRDALAKSQPLPDVRCEPELAWWMRAELALRELLHQERGR